MTSTSSSALSRPRSNKRSTNDSRRCFAKEKAFIERFKARASHAAQVQSRVKKLEKIEKVEPPRRIIEKTFEFRKAPRSGDDVVKVDNVSKTYGKKHIHDNLSLLVRRTERWAVMGENGSGKTTLLR